MKPPLIGITGWKNSGKTTLTERLIGEFTRRGLRVSAIKHAHHNADLDQEGTDTFRHRTAGASEIALVTAKRWALLHESRDEAEITLPEIVARLSPCDLVIVEGFKQDPHPKIEARRQTARDTAPMAGTMPNIIAIAADHGVTGTDLPAFDLDDISAIADFIIDRFLANQGEKR